MATDEDNLCPFDCNLPNGDCLQNLCRCNDNWVGPDCSIPAVDLKPNHPVWSDNVDNFYAKHFKVWNENFKDFACGFVEFKYEYSSNLPKPPYLLYKNYIEGNSTLASWEQFDWKLRGSRVVQKSPIVFPTETNNMQYYFMFSIMPGYFYDNYI